MVMPIESYLSRQLHPFLTTDSSEKCEALKSKLQLKKKKGCQIEASNDAFAYPDLIYQWYSHCVFQRWIPIFNFLLRREKESAHGKVLIINV